MEREGKRLSKKGRDKPELKLMKNNERTYRQRGLMTTTKKKNYGRLRGKKCSRKAREEIK